MDTKAINKAAKACINYIQSGKAKNDNWLSIKKDILNKWNAGFILKDKQVDMIINMYNMEVMQFVVIEDLFSGKVTRPKKPNPIKNNKDLANPGGMVSSQDDYDDLPF